MTDTPEDPFESPEWLQYAKDAEENLVPKITDSAIVMQLFDGKVDAKLAIELGFAILLDKPVMVMVKPGTVIPKNLRAIAAGVLEYGDMNDEKTKLRIHAEITRITKNAERRKNRGK